jgi:sulfur relay protein TusB/DsrH
MACLHIIRTPEILAEQANKLTPYLAQNDGILLIDDGCYLLATLNNLLNNQNIEHNVFIVKSHYSARALPENQKNESNTFITLDEITPLLFKYNNSITYQ